MITITAATTMMMMILSCMTALRVPQQNVIGAWLSIIYDTNVVYNFYTRLSQVTFSTTLCLVL